VRGALKLMLTKQLDKDWGAFGFIAGTVYTLASERADLRTWQTLPHTWQAARVFVTPGEHALRMQAVGGSSVSLGRFEFARGETTFILVRAIGPHLFAHVVGGKRIDLPQAAIAPTTPVSAAATAPAGD
jgi:hypothetical protein